MQFTTLLVQFAVLCAPALVAALPQVYDRKGDCPSNKVALCCDENAQQCQALDTERSFSKTNTYCARTSFCCDSLGDYGIGVGCTPCSGLSH